MATPGLGILVVGVRVMAMIIGVILIILGLALLVLGLMAWKRKLPGNSVFGIRVPEVRKSEEVWRAAHQVAGPIWVVGAISWLLGGLIAFPASGLAWGMPVLFFIVGIILLSVGANFGARTAVLLDEQGSADSDGCDNGSCNCGDGGCAEEAPAPSVDLDALRKAASAQDS